MRLSIGTARGKLLLIVLAFAIAKAAYLFKYHLPVWDEAVYLGMGKYIYSLGSSGLWEIIRPPALPLVIGMLWKLGLPYVLFSEVIIVLFSIGAIIFCYLIANKLFNRKAAILAAALLATSPGFYLYSSYILTDVPSAFLTLLSLYFFIKRHYFFSGAAAAVAMLFKFPNGLLLAAIAATVISLAIIEKRLWQKSQLLPLIKVIASFALVTIPFFVFNYIFYRLFTGNAFDAIFRPLILGAWHQSNPSKAIADHLYNYSFYFAQLFGQHFVFVFSIAAVFLFFRRKWFNDTGKLLLAIFLLVSIAYFTYIPNKDERYFLPFLPMICIFVAAAFLDAFSGLRRKLGISVSKESMQKYVLRLTVVSVAALLALSFAVAMYKDYHFYSWRPALEPPIVAELYRSLPRLGISGPMLASDPLFSAYSDNLIITYYFTSYKGFPQELKALNEWEQNKSFQGVIYSNYPGSLFCPGNDAECAEARSNMPSFLEAHYKPVLNGTYLDGIASYTIFLNESYYEVNP